jgi:phosphatidylglycerophosphatase C
MTGPVAAGPAAQPLAVFDLDGTLVARDTFLPFVVSYARRHRLIRPLVTLPTYLALYACRILSDRAAKERVLKSFLQGRPKRLVAEHAEWFARAWAMPRLRPVVVDRLRDHQRAGHRLVLLSASPEVYVPAIARELGIGEVVCTRVAGDDDVWHGGLTGPNCKGPAKLTLLCEYLSCEQWPAESFAYGDSRHDLDVLRWADSGFLVTRRSGLVRV